jgi:hypothetical protein
LIYLLPFSSQGSESGQGSAGEEEGRQGSEDRPSEEDPNERALLPAEDLEAQSPSQVPAQERAPAQQVSCRLKVVCRSLNTGLCFRLDAYAIVKHPLTTESAMKKIEDTNTLVFIVDVRANKPQIKTAVKKLYNIDVQKVRLVLLHIICLQLLSYFCAR